MRFKKSAAIVLPKIIFFSSINNQKNRIIFLMELLIRLAGEHLGLKINSFQASQFAAYAQLLLEWNQKYNLTAITDPDEIIVKHFLDSLSCLQVIRDRNPFSLIDIGTGAGFPGIPLKIIRPDISLVLVESVGKKASFCAKAIDSLQLDNSRIIQTRAEEIGQHPDHRESYDWAVARAIAELPLLLEYLLPLVKLNGRVLAMKGKDKQSEIKSSQNAMTALGGELYQVEKTTLPYNFGERVLIVVQKIFPSPSKYPRRIGIPAKKPLL